MFFNTFLSTENSIPLMPTDLENLSVIQLYDGMYDDLYITKGIEETETADIPEAWDNDTIFHAKFNDSTWAGNFGLDMDYISDVLVKKRIKGTNAWTTIAVHSIMNVINSVMNAKAPENFNFSGTDFYVRANHDYEYAVVPYANGLEGNYDISEIWCSFDCISICEKSAAYSTVAEVGACDLTRNGNGSTQELLNSKYPLKYKYGESNYDSGSVSGYWIEMDRHCNLDTQNAIDYMYAFKDFLTDGKAKILKHPDGRIWLIAVDEESGINDAQENVLEKRIISFNVTEIGDYNSEKDLYENALSDVTQEYWSRGYV